MEPLDTAISFKPFADFVEERLNSETGVRRQIYSSILQRIQALPAADETVREEDLHKHTELLELIHASLTGITTEADENFWALCVPLIPTLFYGTNDLFDLMKRVADLQMDELGNKNIEANRSKRMIFVYSMILRIFYNFNLNANIEMMVYSKDIQTGLFKYHRVNIDPRFVKITAKQKLPELDFRKLERNVQDVSVMEYLQRQLPMELFSFRGFSILHLTDVTEQCVIENIRTSILEQSSKAKDVCVAEVQLSLKTLMGCKSIEFGFIPFVMLNNKPLLDFGSLSNSILLSYGRNGALPEKDFDKLVSRYIKKPAAFFLKDAAKYAHSNAPIMKIINKAGLASFALIPLYYNEQLTGVMEVYCKTPGLLDEIRLSRLDRTLTHLAQLLKASVDDFQRKIAAIVNEKFTAIQSAVQWKFNEAAFHYMQNKLALKKEPQLETIEFKGVYPLYGAMDIRNSSVERNTATREDILCMLQLLAETFGTLREKNKLALIDEIIFKTKKWSALLQNGLTPSDEFKLNEFFEKEAMPFLNHLKKIQPGAGAIVDAFIKELDEKKGKTHANRRNLEASMQLINHSISEYLDGARFELQQSYPCYFEKFRTDGIEYDIYIGQSIAPHLPFDILYLRNLRLWQLQSMANIYNMVRKLEPQMQKVLHITQLIFINADTIDISFRNDEKRFDVEGAYNIRYQVIKKRIDKVHLKNSEERLTQPGKIAMVYFNDKEADEYISYINYLQEKEVLMNDLEFLELEELQGVAGLKALRVGICEELIAEPADEEVELAVN